jgi:hypothetical protein
VSYDALFFSFNFSGLYSAEIIAECRSMRQLLHNSRETLEQVEKRVGIELQGGVERKGGQQRDFLKVQEEFVKVVGVVWRKVCFLTV